MGLTSTRLETADAASKKRLDRHIQDFAANLARAEVELCYFEWNSA